MAYAGMRWSEALGLLPGCLQDEQLRTDWKLYELESRFYRGRPKDGSIRSVDVPPFLAALIDWYLATYPPRICTCASVEPPWCPGERYVFLGPQGGRFRRSNYSSRIVRAAADGWYPKRGGRAGRPAMPVPADMTGPLPGRPLPPWPSAVARMGHEVPGMAGVYGHSMPRWRQRLRAQLEELWEASLRKRARLDGRSAVRVLDGLLAPYRASRQ